MMHGTDPGTTWCEPTGSQTRLRALSYLREQATVAHHNGDGHEVTHLALLAVDAAASADDAFLSEIRPEHLAWALVLPMSWLANDAIDHWLMVHKRLLDRLCATGDAWRAMAPAVRVLWALIRDPLSVQEDTREGTAHTGLSWCCAALDLEARALLCLVVELLWQRDPHGALWKGAGDALTAAAEDVLPSVAEHLRSLRRRLELQNELLLGAADPAGMAPEDWHIDAAAVAAADAWRGLLMCDWTLVEERLREMGQLDRWDSPLVYAADLARRTSAVRPTDTAANDALELSRRRWARSRHGVARCQRERGERIGGLLRQLWSGGRADTGAVDRLSVFGLVALQQIQALHYWDLLAWRDALSDQVEALAELLRFSGDPGLAGTCIDLAVRSLSLDSKAPWWSWVVARWERGTVEARSSTVGRLLSVRPVEALDTLRAFELLSDAIPEGDLPAVARWFGGPWLLEPSLRGFDPFPLGVWADILPYVDAQHEIANALSPALQAALPRARWDDGRHSSVVAMWLGAAPADEAMGVAEELLRRASEQPQHADGIVWTIGVAAEGRAELRARFGHDLLTRTNDPWCRLSLLDAFGWSGSVTEQDHNALKGWAKESLLAYADSVLSRQPGQLKLGGRSWAPEDAIAKVEWGADDHEVVARLASAIECPQVLHTDCQVLYSLVGAIARAASPDLLRAIEAHASVWLTIPPPLGHAVSLPSGPLSRFQVRMPGPDEALRGFTCLVRELRSRTDCALHGSIDEWAVGMSGACAPAAIPVLAAVLLEGSEDRTAPDAGVRASLSMALIDRLAAQSRDDKAAQYLAEAIRCVTGRLVPILADHAAEEDVYTLPWGPVVLWGLRLVGQAAGHASPYVRQAAGALLAEWEARASLPESVAQVLQALRSDARARVRYSSRPLSSEEGAAESGSG